MDVDFIILLMFNLPPNPCVSEDLIPRLQDRVRLLEAEMPSCDLECGIEI